MWFHPASISLRKGKGNALRLKFAPYTKKIIWGRKGIKAAQIKDSRKEISQQFVLLKTDKNSWFFPKTIYYSSNT